MDEPILPARPLRLRRVFVLAEWLRALVLIAPVLAVLAAFAVAHGRGAYELFLDQRAWARGEQAVVTDQSAEAHELALRVYRVVARASCAHDGEVFRTQTHYYALAVEGAPPEVEGARFDASSRRMVLSTSVLHAKDRWAFYGLVLALLALCVAIVVAILRRRLAAYRSARAAARRGTEVELEVVEMIEHPVHDRPAILEVRYRAPVIDGDRAVSYRDDARARDGEVRSERFSVHAKPILLAGETRVLALAAEDRATLVREDFWPFELDAAQASEARARLGARDQPPSVPASNSEIGTHLPVPSNT